MIERKIIENIQDGCAPDGRRAVRIDFEDGDWTYWYVDSDAEAEAMRHLIGWEVDIEGPADEVELITLH
jgi:hypothetical protein